DKETTKKVTDEALTRSHKDVHLAHVFISFLQNNYFDSVAAKKKLDEVMKKLKSGESFSSVARQLSDDPSAKQNEGDLGYITVFSLPYELENIAYSLPIGKTSEPYRSKAGYHIFKNLGERRDIGRIKAAQILLAFPPDADDATKAKIKKLADSIYNRLKKGDDFAKLASQFSNDVASATANGQMPEFGSGQYDAVFEKNVFAIPSNNMISRPFLTSYGYHIVKRLDKLPSYSSVDARSMDNLKEKVTQSDRMKMVASAMAHKAMKNEGFRKMNFNNGDLWIFSDSVINYAKPGKPVIINGNTPLFEIGNKIYTANDWIQYAQTFRYKSDGSGIKPYPQLWDEYIDATATTYYQNHLEDFNESFRKQINEFKEGNLFFEIMQREIWGPAQSDSLALLNYYEKNKRKYNWSKSADAVIFYASDATTAKSFYDQLRKDPISWRKLLSGFSEKIAADSSRFELSQIPNPTKKTLAKGILTDPVINKADNTTSFAYVLQIHDQPEPRKFSESKGLVINDYQNELEKNWIAKMESKYPVRINERELDRIIKEKKY
ncbi:MAG: peptidylprolyl isomerase, partial [Flavisolibacter sp.]